MNAVLLLLKRVWHYMQIRLVLIHSIWVLAVAVIAGPFFGTPDEANRGMFWLLVAIPDLPAIYVSGYFLQWLNDVAGLQIGIPLRTPFEMVFAPIVWLIVAGGLQWWVIGELVRRISHHCRRKQHQTSPRNLKTA